MPQTAERRETRQTNPLAIMMDKDPAFSDISKEGKIEDLDRLLSLMIHQIRNYCMSIKGYASLLDYEDGVTDKGRKWIGNISRGIGSLEGFLGEFEYYRMAKKAKDEKLEISLLVRNAWKTAVELYGADLVTAELDLSIDDKVEMTGDSNDFRKMVFQLLRNALEASSGEGRISVHVEGECGEDGEHWILEIQDRGCGMNVDEKDKAGEILYSTKSSHIGCGLNLVAAVASKMNAKVELRSETGVGTVVRIKK